MRSTVTLVAPAKFQISELPRLFGARKLALSDSALLSVLKITVLALFRLNANSPIFDEKIWLSSEVRSNTSTPLALPVPLKVTLLPAIATAASLLPLSADSLVLILFMTLLKSVLLAAARVLFITAVVAANLLLLLVLV